MQINFSLHQNFYTMFQEVDPTFKLRSNFLIHPAFIKNKKEKTQNQKDLFGLSYLS